MVNYLRKIKDGKHTLIVIKNDKIIFKSNNSGLKDLLFASEKNFLEDAIIYDKLIGLAAAKIAVFSKAKELHTLLASELAVNFCQNKRIPLKAEKIVERIYDSKNKNECYLEKMAQKINSLPVFLKHFNSLYET
jgi:hypothetical protein